MKVTLNFGDFIKLTSAWNLLLYYIQKANSFYIFALGPNHTFDTRVAFEDIVPEGSINAENAITAFKNHYLSNAIQAIATDAETPEPTTLPTIPTIEKGIPGQMPRRKVQEMNRLAVSRMSDGMLENFINLINEEKEKRKKTPKKEVSTTHGGTGTAGYALVPVSIGGSKRRCEECGTFVARGVKKCPVCGSTNLGTGAPKPKFTDIDPTQAAAMFGGISQMPKKKENRLEKELEKFVGFGYFESLPYILRFLQTYKFDEITDIDLKQKENIRAALIQSLREGTSLGELTDQINGIVGDENKANMIARTETTRAANRGKIMNIIDRGYKGTKKWVARVDAKTSQLCLRLDGQIVDVDKEFIDPDGKWRGQCPPAHVLCRSVMEFVPSVGV